MKYSSIFLIEAMEGTTSEDKCKKYWKYDDHQKIFNETKENIEANNLSLDEMNNLIPFIFSK